MQTCRLSLYEKLNYICKNIYQITKLHIINRMRTIILNMSGTYKAENFQPEDSTVIDLENIEGTSCYCDPDAQNAIRNSIKDLQPQGIHWIDSGDYHYLTYFWIEKISEPFELLLIDNHTDDQLPAFGDDLLSCGGWVQTSRNNLSHLKKDYFTRRGLPQELSNPGLPLYISLDKDALCDDFARTDWNQGDLSLEELKNAIRNIRRRIIGIDICGEISKAKGASEKDLTINQKTNSELQDFFINLPTE